MTRRRITLCGTVCEKDGRGFLRGFFRIELPSREEMKDVHDLLMPYREQRGHKNTRVALNFARAHLKLIRKQRILA